MLFQRARLRASQNLTAPANKRQSHMQFLLRSFLTASFVRYKRSLTRHPSGDTREAFYEKKSAPILRRFVGVNATVNHNSRLSIVHGRPDDVRVCS